MAKMGPFRSLPRENGVARVPSNHAVGPDRDVDFANIVLSPIFCKDL